MLVPEMFAQLGRIDALDLNQANAGGRCALAQGCPDLDAWVGSQQGFGPAVAQQTEAGNLPLGSNGSMEREGQGDGVVTGGRMGADLLELADVVGHRGVRGHQRPDGLQFRLPDIEKPRSHGPKRPLMQTGGKVVALQIVALEREVSERVGAVDEDGDPFLACQPNHVPHRQDLS